MKRTILSIVIIAAYLTMMGFAEEISKLLGLPGTTTHEYLLIPNLILLIVFYMYDIFIYFNNPKKEQSIEEKEKRQRIYKRGWTAFQAMILVWLYLYFLTYYGEPGSKGESIGFGITIMAMFGVVYKLYLYGIFKKL